MVQQVMKVPVVVATCGIAVVGVGPGKGAPM